MKKTLSVILALCFIFSICVFQVSAGSADVLKGTPIVDGSKDEIYDQSYSMKVGPTFYNTGETDGNADATLFALYDEKYLYICVDVIDDDIVAADAEYIKDQENPWESEAVEVWIDEIGDGSGKGKFSVEATSGRVFWDINATTIDPSKLIGKTVKTDKGYSVELAIEFPNPIKEGGSVGIALQINDRHADGSTSAMGTQTPGDNLIKLGAAIVPPAPPVTEAPAPVAEDTPAPEVVADTPAVPEKANPVTGDEVLFMAALGIFAAVAFVTVKKVRVK